MNDLVIPPWKSERISFPTDVLRLYPVRKTKAQKSRFRQAVQDYASQLGYPCREEPGGLGVQNLVIGDPERAAYLITAHYDTCARLPFPNFLTPCNLGIFLLFQMLLVTMIVLPVAAASALAGWITRSPILGALAANAVLLTALWLMLRGPANPSNANDNTSGVITVLETMAALPEELRETVCFVLFDLEEAGMWGSASYRRKHKKATRRQVVFNADCVGDGTEIVFIPTRKLKKHCSLRISRWKESFPDQGPVSITLRDKGICIYPSDQTQFPLGVGIAAFQRGNYIGLYLSRIHTPNDTICDQANIRLIRDCLIDLIRNELSERTKEHADL